MHASDPETKVKRVEKVEAVEKANGSRVHLSSSLDPFDLFDHLSYSLHGSRSASERRRLACSSAMNSSFFRSYFTCRPRKRAMFAAWQAMCALQAASAFPF